MCTLSFGRADGGVGVGGCQPALCNLLRDRGLEFRASHTPSRRVALSSFQTCSRATSLLLWRTAAAIERARAGSRSNTSQEVRRNMCSDSCRSIDSVSLVMKPPKHFPLKLATRALNLSGWRDWSYFFVWRVDVKQTTQSTKNKAALVHFTAMRDL